MIHKRWMQLRGFLFDYWFWKPIWRNSCILGPSNVLIQRLFSWADRHCLRTPSGANMLFGYPIVKVDNVLNSKKEEAE